MYKNVLDTISVDLEHIPVTSWMAWMTDMATGMGLASTRLKQAGMLVLLTCDKAWNEGKLQRNHTHDKFIKTWNPKLSHLC